MRHIKNAVKFVGVVYGTTLAIDFASGFLYTAYFHNKHGRVPNDDELLGAFGIR